MLKPRLACSQAKERCASKKPTPEDPYTDEYQSYLLKNKEHMEPYIKRLEKCKESLLNALKDKVHDMFEVEEYVCSKDIIDPGGEIYKKYWQPFMDLHKPEYNIEKWDERKVDWERN